MQDPEAVLKARLLWVEMYQQTGNLGLTCRRCGISAPTLRKWTRRYQAQGAEGLRSQSRRPHKLPERRVTPEHERLILEMRRTRRLGPKGLQRELKRLHQIAFSTSTLWKVLAHHGVSVLRPARRLKKKPKRYKPPRARGSSPGGHLQDRQAAVPIHRHRRLHPAASAGALHGPLGCQRRAFSSRAIGQGVPVSSPAHPERPRK